MYTVGRLGSYITQGVYTVSGPFHPFGGAVDIIVVEQQDGSLKSSPWYVRFGKFQGVLKAKEKVVNISVDGVQADFHMYLDNKGEAFFLREVDVEEEGDSVLYPSSSGEDTDGKSRDTRPLKSKSCNYDADQSDLVTRIDIENGKIVTRTSSRRSRIMGLVFGRKSVKKDRSQEEEDGTGVVRADSLERAEIAADLLEVNWSTNLASSRRRKDNKSQFSAPSISECEEDKGLMSDDGQGEMDSPLHDNKVSSLDHPVLFEHPVSVKVVCNKNYDLDSQTVMVVDELCEVNADHDENVDCFIFETTDPHPDSAELDSCPSKMLDEDRVLKKVILLSGSGLHEESGADRREGFAYCETLEGSRVGLDGSGGQTNETLYVSFTESAEVSVHAKTLHDTAELLSEVNSVQDINLLVAKEPLDFPESLADENCANLFSDARNGGSEATSSHPSAKSTVIETYTQMVNDGQLNLVKEVECSSILTISGCDNIIYGVHDRENRRDDDNLSNLQYSSKPLPDSQEFRSGGFLTEAITVSPSEGSEEEQLLFGDLDDFNHQEPKGMEEETHPSVTSKRIEAEIESLNPNAGSLSSADRFFQEKTLNDDEDFREKSRLISSPINIPRSKEAAGENFGKMAESLPNMRLQTDDMVVDDVHHSSGHSLDANPKSSKWTPLGEDLSSNRKSDAEKDDLVSLAQLTVEEAQTSDELKNGPANPAGVETIFEPKGMIPINQVEKTFAGNPSEGINASNGSWGVWPFKRSKSMKNTQPAQNSNGSSDAENTLERSTSIDGEKDALKPEVKRKNVREITPTPEQLASLNLKQGKNTVTFTFSTSMLGPQQVDARIYLWKWDTRVVISDVDGTITKSDVLGQFMPLVGRDWSQTGVAHLFSDIKENGYQLLFLSARAISQAYHTRQFLFNLKQDGKALPDGPVVISPDGLFPSLYREVIRRAPHEFKIGCLEHIRALFPSDRNPFYAGFGNRDTDEFSYLKVGIPKGKIFIINPKGEVAVNHRVDTKSYTSLHTLVHDMFPPMSSSEEQALVEVNLSTSTNAHPDMGV
ncbi:phosphatidic acid phosphohydrolase 2 [Actinidia rufa]|uniref:Phosphatidic acid phosphohydrolase 2 n=1 Tax=Actinidia rufa TaxID=165716 RepID=A0A7J0EKF8_9ERIC|nr:phosphatidic acid phosphohydrolase 2 [Actinidia rufa]